MLKSEGDERYRQSDVTLTDADIPEAVARDAETDAAVAAHAAAPDPHPSLWTRITNAFLALTGGQSIVKNNPSISAVSYAAGQNHLEFRTTDGSNPIVGFHRGGFTATALYHAGYGANSLKLRNADGYDAELLHKVNHLDIPNPHPAYPIFSRAIFTGNCPGANGTTSIAHGLTASRIKSFTAFATIYPNTSSEVRIQPGGGVPAWVGSNFYYSVDIGPTNISIRTNANSAGVTGAAVTIVVDYI